MFQTTAVRFEIVMSLGFSWVLESQLAGLAYPGDAADMQWLRDQGIQVLISLTETPPPRRWINDAGLMAMHFPVPDMSAPSQELLHNAVAAMERAIASDMPVAVHCAAGRGRTGTVLAAYLVRTGIPAADAIRQIRESRPGSIETFSQEEAVYEFSRSQERK